MRILIAGLLSSRRFTFIERNVPYFSRVLSNRDLPPIKTAAAVQ